MNRVLLFLVFTITCFAGNDLAGIKKSLSGRITEHVFDNGLTLLVFERHNAPVLAAQIGMKVGGSDERSGCLGATHMLEHMLFKGTREYGTKDFSLEQKLEKKIEYWARKIDKEKREDKPSSLKLKYYEKMLKGFQDKQNEIIVKNPYSPVYSSNGSTGFNAYTSNDNTVYIIELPSNKLELWALLESKRFRDTVLRNYYQERSVVNEERKMRTDSSPRGKMWETIGATAFKVHPYRSPVIGWKSEIEVLEKDELKRFYKEYYVPNNCVISLVGDVDPQHAIKVIGKYFGDWKPNFKLQRTKLIEPEQNGERFAKIYENAQPCFYGGYHMPRLNTREGAALSLFSDYLSKGRTSPFYEKLVVEQQIASAAFTATGLPGDRYPGLFFIGGYPREIGSMELLEEMDKIINETIKNGLEETRLKQILRSYKAELIYAFEENSTVAGMLLRTHLNYGSWKEIFEGMERTLSITSEEIIQAAKKYLTPKNRSIVELVSTKKGQ
jgi:predicted Zn-dependent peptidase